MIELDGSLGEGGGQILRTALALSLITQQPFRIHNIRAKRPKPGLMRQHLACVQAAARICADGDHALAVAVDDEGQPVQVGSTSLRFTPAPVRAGAYEFSIGSAGSCMLMLQTVLWPLALAKGSSRLTLRGGTHNPMAPFAQYLQMLASLCLGLHESKPQSIWQLELLRHGFYPAGGGEVRVAISPPAQGLVGFELRERGNLLEASAECLHAGLPRDVAERELAALGQALGWQREALHNRALRANEGPGNALIARLRYEHITELFASFGEKGVSAEQVAQTLVKEIRDFQGAENQAPVGPYMADQLMLPAALAAEQGRTSFYRATEITPHATTNAQVIERFLNVHCDIQRDGAGGEVKIFKQ
jgi:RNA 3'-terminal phosphate cyclase (ATP)